jgi:hypothetical protein
VALGALTACTGGVDRATDVLASLPTPAASVFTSSATSAPSPTGRPLIVVESPLAGDELVSPITVRGKADVFEGRVDVRILDASGQVLAAINIQASCGSGCRGTFSTPLAFFTPVRQAGTIEVFEGSAQEGSPINVVSIPITLVPGT